MTALWTSQEASIATRGKALGPEWQAFGVSIDTRSLNAGDLFVALSDQRDGHDFLAAAFAKGAAAALVSYIPEGLSADLPLILVTDVLRALGDLGRAARARTKARVIGVTGSVGKTSTKEMLRKLLGGQGKTHAAHASFNNHWGVPLTLARMPKDAQFAVIEIGMNHPGEIAPLATMAELDVAIITTVGSAHLAAFSDVVDIAHEKSEIFKGLRPLGAAIFPIDIEQSAILLDHATALGAKIFGFETGEIAQGLRTLRPECSIWRATDVNMTSNMSTMQVSYGALAPLDAQDGQKVGRLMLRISAAGWHFVANALGVLAVAEALGLDLTLAALDLEQWHSVAGRGQVEKIWVDLQGDLNFSLIDDAFNANPASMAASLAVLALYQPQHGVGRVMKGRRIAFLGDMLELGSHEKKLHRAISDLPVIAEIDLIHCVGPRMRALYDALPSKKRGEWAESAYDLIPRAYHLIDAGDIVLIKGSKGSKVSLMVDALRNLGQGEPPIAIRDL